MDDVVERSGRSPTALFEHGPTTKLGRVSETQVSDGLDARRQPELATEHARLDNADPAHAHAFGASRQPQILNRTAGARPHRLRLGGGAQDRFVAIAKIDRNAQIQGRFANSLQLVRQVSVTARTGKSAGLGFTAA